MGSVEKREKPKDVENIAQPAVAVYRSGGQYPG